MQWINFQKTPPVKKGVYFCALSELNQKDYTYSIVNWNGKVFVDLQGVYSYPCSMTIGGIITMSASVMWYMEIIPPS